MKAWYFVILLFVFHTTNSTKKNIRLDKTIAPLMKQCSKIKCPPVHSPVCAKLVNNETGHTVHAVLVNKCEKKYVECYPGVQAKLVPMKFCSHAHVNTKGQEINAKGKSFDHKRVKRGIIRDKETAEHTHSNVVDLQPMNAPETKKQLLKKAKKVTENLLMNAKKVTKTLQLNAKDVTENLSKNPKEESEKTLKKTTNLPLKKDKIETIEKKGPALFFTYQNEDEKLSDSFNWLQIYPKVDSHNYAADCPKVCPIRSKMVCGRCQHGIYTTYLSVCHMRMHFCAFKNDSIELVSRNPCMMLSPLILTGEKQKLPVGRVIEPNDDDKVLRHILCRDRKTKGAYCKKRPEEHKIVSAQSEDERDQKIDEDTDGQNLSKNSGDGSDPKHPKENTYEEGEEKIEKSATSQDVEEKNEYLDVSNRYVGLYNPSLDIDFPKHHMNAGSDVDKSNQHMNAGGVTFKQYWKKE